MLEKAPESNKAPVVIICSDDDDMHNIVQIIRQKFAVVKCTSFHEVSKLKLKKSPLAFICDPDSSKLSRLNILAGIKGLSQQDRPIFILSGDEREESIVNGFLAGVSDYLLKPVRPGEILAKFDRYINKRKNRTSSSIPRRIGPYLLQEAIGRGGTSAVFRAWHVDAPDQNLAVKVIWPHLVSDAEVIQRFRREIVLLQNLDHPGLIHFIASGRHDDWFYYVMEHVKGGTLRERIDEHGPCKPEAAAKLLLELAKPLSYLHKQGLIHRDVKPENIYFADDRVILGDFGLAKLFTDRGITLDDDILGTPLYLAPEALKNEDIDRRADIYAAGMCALEWLKGGVALKARDAMALIAKISNEGIPPPRELIKDLPDDLCSLLEDCLANDPNERIGNADILVNRSKAILQARHQTEETEKFTRPKNLDLDA
ncbi:MAG: protein kinase [Planctomycetota bacterium]|nr:protein kinase [Planctomycetota bacterium]